METYKVRKLKKNGNYTVCVPGSKSITNRALLLAALSNGTSILKGVLFSDDSRHFLKSLMDLGFKVDVDEEKKIVKVEGLGGTIPYKEGTINVGSAGTAARFLTCMCGLADGTYTIDASNQMKKRPMKPLMKALEGLGAKITYLEEKYHLPIVIKGCGDIKGRKSVELDISESTQFLSALLMTATMLKDGLDINITSKKKYGSYIGITMKMMSQYGVEAHFDEKSYHIEADSSYNAIEYQIEPDVSAACYFFAMAAISASTFKVLHISKNSMQGDIKFLEVLDEMGCKVSYEADGVSVEGPNEKLKGIDINMNNFSDQTMTLAAIAVFADSPTRITGIGHIRLQESDRLMAIVNEFTKMGIKVEYGEDYIVIYPSNPTEATIDTYDDHRMAMSFALVGIVTGKITINNPMCCRKTFENYFDIVDEITAVD